MVCQSIVLQMLFLVPAIPLHAMFHVSYYIVCKVQLAEEQIDDRMDFLITARVIQDCLANFFSAIRLETAIPSDIEYRNSLKIVTAAQSLPMLVTRIKTTRVLCFAHTLQLTVGDGRVQSGFWCSLSLSLSLALSLSLSLALSLPLPS